ncbi:Uncharacterised protein [uncultured archaeon]|nr:Uncharacterised protein [uncultured archaeon]
MANWAEKIVEDIKGAFLVFVVSAVLIYASLAIAKSLYPSFPFDNNSYGIVAVIAGLFIGFVKYIKNKNP